MDTRLLVIAVPLLIAASWALYNIGRLAIQQSSTFITLMLWNLNSLNKMSVIFDFLRNMI